MNVGVCGDSRWGKEVERENWELLLSKFVEKQQGSHRLKGGRCRLRSDSRRLRRGIVSISEARSGQRGRNLTVERNEPNANCEESCNFQEPFVLFLSVCTPSMVVGVVAGVVVS